jgi:Ca2+-binding RTX toxin-like protein
MRPLSIIVALVAALLIAAPAHAGVLWPAGGGVIVVDRTGEVNDVTIAYSAAEAGWSVSDAAGLTLPPFPLPCSRRSATEFFCTVVVGGALLGPQDDRFKVAGDQPPGTVKDELLLVPDGYVLQDFPVGILVYGGAGNDTLIGGAGLDSIYGGDRRDTDEEGLVAPGGDGTSGDDVLRGGPTMDYLAGGDGNDRIEGEDGDDQLSGNRGNDVLVGGNGNDHFEILIELGDDFTSEGDDRMLGGPGNDAMRGDRGADSLDGGPGDDHMSLQGVDAEGYTPKPDPRRGRGSCGAGDDTIWPGHRDTIRSDCEVVKEYPYCEKGCRGSVKARAGGRTVTLAKGSGKHYVRMRLGRALKRLLRHDATIRAWTMGAHKGSPLERMTPFTIRR